MTPLKFLVKNKKITLTDDDYLGSGGQAVVYSKNGVVYKIYHDPNKLIPEAKIDELQVLSDLKNVIIPETSVYQDHKRVGFTMKYIPDAEFLCKLFTMNYKKDNKISNQMIIDLVSAMQKTLVDIHTRKVLIGDYNEMNFLTDRKYKIPYHIDMDSVQTENYPCNAIMESIRDRKLPFGKFNDMSDWYSFAIVTFQLYCGIHPYRGKHPDYTKKNWLQRMDDGVSVFDKDSRVPGYVNYSLIPKNHLSWYKRLFVEGDRCSPPSATGIANIQMPKKLYIDTKCNIKVESVYKYNSPIVDVQYRNGKYYVLTEKGLYFDNKLKMSFDNEVNIGHILFTPSQEVVIIVAKNEQLFLFDIDKNLIYTIESNKYTIYNNLIYTITLNGVIQYKVERIGKIRCISTKISNVYYNSSKVYDGVIIQDIIGKYKVILPYEIDKCSTINIPELKGCRILEAKHLKGWLFILYEKLGKVSCMSMLLNNGVYEYRIDKDVTFRNLNVIMKPNNMIIFNKDDNDLELFVDFKRGTKKIEHTPVYNHLQLINGRGVNFINNNEIFSIK